jgi:hypothetical protein
MAPAPLPNDRLKRDLDTIRANVGLIVQASNVLEDTLRLIDAGLLQFGTIDPAEWIAMGLDGLDPSQVAQLVAEAVQFRNDRLDVLTRLTR